MQMWTEPLWTADFVHWHKFFPRRKIIENSPVGTYCFGAIRGGTSYTEINDTWFLPFSAYRLPYKHWNGFIPATLAEFKKSGLRVAAPYAPDFENWEQFYELCKKGTIYPAMATCPVGRLSHAELLDDSEPGELVTTPVEFSGRSLVINGNAEPGGSIRVELLNEKGKAIRGYGLKACKPLTGDQLRHEVLWKGKDLTALQNKPVQIRFVLDKAKLYAYTIK